VRRETRNELALILSVVAYQGIISYWILMNPDSLTGLHTGAIIFVTMLICVAIAIFYHIPGEAGAGSSMRGDPPTL